TLEEKIGQLNLLSVGADVTGPIISQGVDEKIAKGLVGGVFNIYGPSSVRKLQQLVMQKSRLKIPLIFGYDVIHGHRTAFPIPLALAATWDLPLIEKTASAAAAEASADGLNWTFSPMVDIARDPRWGRCTEGAGEDPYLGGRIAKAMVHGYQGDSYAGVNKVMACVKHFALYGAAEAGRDYNTVDMSRVRMYNEYLPPYKAAVDANVASVMSSFNEIDGVPATGNKWLMTDLLRKQWDFKGFIATDYTAVSEMIEHGVGDDKKVAELALNAGIDMDMVSELFIKYGPALVKSGRVSQAQVDAACRRVLEAKYKLGLFEDPYRFCNEDRRKKEILSSDKLALSKEAATKSIVLLKNSNQVLPLSAEKKIAFIGPLVKEQRNLLGSWSGAGQGKECTSLWQALETKYGSGKFLYSKGCNLVQEKAMVDKLNHDGGELTLDEKSTDAMIQEAVETAKQADVAVAVLGEPCSMSGEASSRSNIGLFEHQIELLKALKQTGKPVVLVLMNGRPLTLSWEDKHMDAIVEAWYGGNAAGTAIADVLFGDANPSGRITMTFPRNVGQVPIYYNSKNTGRPFAEAEKYHSKYLDVQNEPLYPFGYGLSYTTYQYGDVSLSGQTLANDGKASITVKTTVTNTGKHAGVETVQLYVRDMVGSITRPVKELKGFQQVSLKPGESKTVSFTLTSNDLRFYNSDLKYVAEPGDFKVFVGTNSQTVKSASFKLLP
ncbi:MAG: beta-glucosidase BglX, partial [Cyanobacteria bacterium SZAS LIN-2]|nr:beta-glucosidase BglX [Cyanobacteria bacterium SZAS LIN-2]